MRLLAALLTLGITGCDDSMSWCTPGPWHIERWSDSPAVFAQVRDGCGFPDIPTDYWVMAHGRIVLEGSLEHFSRRHEIRRVEGGVEIAIWDRACIVTAAGASCRAIDYMRWETTSPER